MRRTATTRPYTYDVSTVKELRGALIDAGLKILADNPVIHTWSKYKMEYIMRTATTVLPRLNAGRNDDTDLNPAPLLAGKTKTANELQNDAGGGQTASDEKENP